MSVKSGNPDRRGFTLWLNSLMGLGVVALLLLVLQKWTLGLALLLFSGLSFIALEAASTPPANQPKSFQYFVRCNISSRRRPVLVCLGDSLTHGTCSANYIPDIPMQLTAALAMEPPKRSIFADPLWVVNCGQNHITTHTILRERLNKALDCHPDYILLLIGTNDMRGTYNKNWGKQVKYINELPEVPSLPTFQRNLAGILSYIQQASPVVHVGLCTLPPMGEDLKSPANQLIRQANRMIEDLAREYGDRCTLIPLFDRFETILEKQGKRTSSLALSPLLAVCMTALYQWLPGMISWNTLGGLVSHHLLTDGIHLNERARDELVALIVDWLVNAGVAKAIAVKS
jgi:lysophospholipase L1-like esterase